MDKLKTEVIPTEEINITNEEFMPVYLTFEHMQNIASMFDIAVRSHGIQVVKQVAPILEILDESLKEFEKNAGTNQNG